ncbi:MAG: CHAT domain-containing tetratricopeptide repeat protein [Bacteroidota bacterium]
MKSLSLVYSLLFALIFLLACSKADKSKPLPYDLSTEQLQDAKFLDSLILQVGNINLVDTRVKTLMKLDSILKSLVQDPFDYVSRAKKLENLGRMYFNRAKYAEAASIFYHGANSLMFLGFDDYRMARSFLKQAEQSPIENDSLRQTIRLRVVNAFIQAYSEEGIRDQAELYTEELRDIIKRKQIPITETTKGSVIQNIAMSIYINSDMKEVKKAEELCFQAIQHFRDCMHPGKDSLIGLVYGNLGLIYEEGIHANPAKALSYHKMADSIFLSLYEKQENMPSVFINLYYNMANAYRHLGDLKKAQELNQKSLDLGELAGIPTDHPQNMVTFGRFGMMHEENNQYREAVFSYQKAISLMSAEDFDPGDLYALPNPDSIILRFGLNAGEVLLKKASSLDSLDLDPNFLIDAYENALDFTDRLKQNYPYSKYQYTIADSGIVYFERIFELGRQILEKNACEDVAKRTFAAAEQCRISGRTFEISEQGRASLIGQELYRNSKELLKQGSLFEVPDSIMERDNELFAQVRNLNMGYGFRRVMGFPIGPLADKLKAVYKEIESFRRYVEDKHPEYARLRFPQKTGDIASIQEQLAEDQCILSISMGRRGVHAWLLTKAGVEYRYLGEAALVKALVKEYGKAIREFNEFYFKSDGAIALDADSRYRRSGAELYRILLKPFEASLKKRVIIVPDAEISQISFAGLPKEEGVSFLDSTHTNEIYVNDKHAISYAPSASVWRDLQLVSREKGPFVMVLPSFSLWKEGNFPYKSELKEGKKLVKDLRQYTDIDLYTGRRASLGNVKEYLSEAGILYFYTHASANPDTLYQANLALSDSNLHISKVYDLKLNADLCLLNACESAQGKYMQGQGIQSLNLAFIQAGCRSVVSSLWEIEEQVSRHTNLEFILQLKEMKLSRDLALQAAQQRMADVFDYHPALWSCEILSGSTDRVSF